MWAIWAEGRGGISGGAGVLWAAAGDWEVCGDRTQPGQWGGRGALHPWKLGLSSGH